MKGTLLIIAAIVVAVTLIVLEGRRQRRRLERSGELPGTRPSLIGAGMLELQGHLQPDRKVEVLQQEAAGRESSRPEYRPAREGEDGPVDECESRTPPRDGLE